MSLNTVFAACFFGYWSIWFNLVLLLVVQIEWKGILLLLFIDFLRKAQNLKSNGSEQLEENCSPSQTSCLCSEHFTESCFIQGKINCRLHKDAVPSVFLQFPKHLQSHLENGS